MLLTLLRVTAPALVGSGALASGRKGSAVRMAPSDDRNGPPLSVIIPSYNEAERLPETLDASLSYLHAHAGARRWELIVVDDGSSDGTLEACRPRQRAERGRLRLLRSSVNRGKGAALAAGCRQARGDRMLLMDADGGTPLSSMPLLERAMDSAPAGCGVVVGARRSGSSRRSRWRRLMGWIFRRLAATAVGGVEDTQCGFKLLSREAAAATMPHLRVWRWAYDVELLHLAQRLGFGVACVPVPAADMPGSKVRWHTPWQMAYDVARVSALYRLGVWRVPGAGGRGGEGGACSQYVEEPLE